MGAVKVLKALEVGRNSSMTQQNVEAFVMMKVILLSLFSVTYHFNAEILRLPCKTFANFSIVKEGKTMKQPFLSLEGIGPESCMYECIKHHRCQSININVNESICEFNGKAWDSELSTRFLSDRVGWRFISPTKERMLGENCKKHGVFFEEMTCVDSCSCPGFEYKRHCDVKYEPVGCYIFYDKYFNGLFQFILITELDTSMRVWNGHTIDWNNYDKQLSDIVCRCLTLAASKGFKVGAIVNSGECWTDPYPFLIYKRFGESNGCLTSNFTRCQPNDRICAGQDRSMYLYKIL
ncbi:uncharacterized protein LOC135687052 isoform X2 [Rhopilema esculentum]|uniref:uncharacterized protein LOC135687052 isoform X2 n=1 Tax=Rhopilema esculentum TaxID=499914 RepID=UPI0031DA2C9F